MSSDIDITTGLAATLTPHISDRGQYRDHDGRLPGAPAWSGDLATLPDDLLDGRVEALGAHIGRLFTSWNAIDRTWSATTPDAAELERWVQARLAALREQERRRI